MRVVQQATDDRKNSRYPRRPRSAIPTGDCIDAYPPKESLEEVLANFFAQTVIPGQSGRESEWVPGAANHAVAEDRLALVGSNRDCGLSAPRNLKFAAEWRQRVDARSGTSKDPAFAHQAATGMGLSATLWLKAATSACSCAPGLSRSGFTASTKISGSSLASATKVCSMKSSSGIARGSPLL